MSTVRSVFVHRRAARGSALVLALLAAASLSGVACSRSPGATGQATKTEPKTAAEAPRPFGGLPVAFERNVGQTDPDVAFLSRGGSSTVFLTNDASAVFVMTEAPKRASSSSAKAKTKVESAPKRAADSVVRMKLLGASPAVSVVGDDELPGRANYLVGAAPSHKKDVPRYQRVRAADAYPGIDAVYYGGKDHALEYDFVVRPGADPKVVTLGFEGATRVVRRAGGDLEVGVGGESLVLKAPVAYQVVDGARREVAASYVVSGSTVRFSLGDYDATKTLVIDPLVQFSSYLGGAGAERITCLARDSAGNFYLSGSTTSANFPKNGNLPGQDTLRGGRDAFVTKLNPTASQVLYSTYLGGSGDELMTDAFLGFETGSMRTCAVDAQGRAYVSTTTTSADFPTTAGAFDTTLGGALDSTLSRLNAAGNALEYSTFVGGSSSEYWAMIAIEPTGHAWIVGHTASADFPVKSAIQATKANPGNPDDADLFIARIVPDGSNTTFGTYLGGSSGEYPFDLALDANQNPVITGATSSTNFPTTAGVLQPAYGGGATAGLPHGDAFVTKLNAQGGTATLGFSTYVGGSENDMGQSVAVGADGSIYVGGVTTSTNFPGQVSRPGTTPAFDGFVIKLNATGTQRVFSRLFGEDGLDGVYDVAVNAAGNMFVAGTGTLGSTTVNGCGRPGDKGLLGMLKTDGSGWEYLTPFGEVNSQILVDANDTAYVAGWGASGSIPQIGTVAQPTYGGGTSDAYLMKLDKLPNATATGCGPCTGDFGGAGPRACPQTSPKCLASGECVATGACNTDTDCGGTTSGRVCDAKVCKDGCRGTGGNGCPSGKVCSSTSNAVGTCQNPPPDAGPDAAPDAAVPPVDAAVPPVDAAAPPVDAAAVDLRNDNGSLEGGGVSCSASQGGGEGASGAFAALGLVGLALVARGRRRAK